jgi:hypothetical protein
MAAFPKRSDRRNRMQGLRHHALKIVGVVLMLAAIIAYVASLDDSEPESAAIEDSGPATQ